MSGLNGQECEHEMGGQEFEYDVHLPTLLGLLLLQTCNDASHVFQHSISMKVEGQATVLLLLSHSQVCDCEYRKYGEISIETSETMSGPWHKFPIH